MKTIIAVFIQCLFLVFGICGMCHAVTIDSMDYMGCISEAGQTNISVSATDPDEGNLIYHWEVMNGPSALIVGSGPAVIFDPPNTGPHPCPYVVKVRVTTDASDRYAEETIHICVKVGGDVTGDGIVNALDMTQVRNHFMETGTPGWIDADLNCDGMVNAMDLLQVRNTFMQQSECVQSYFHDNFECGTQKWTLSGQDWGILEDSVNNGDYSITDSLGGNYPNYADSIIRLKYSVDLSTATAPVLTFWGKCAMSTHGYSDDYIYVDISTDGGWTWETVWQRHDLNQSTWKQEMIDLTPYITDRFKMRFRLVSDETGVEDGWTIDDVEIREFDALSAPTYPFFDDFEDGIENWILSDRDWMLTEDDSVSATHALAERPGENYTDYSDVIVQSKGLMDISAATAPLLTFWGKCAMSTHGYSDDYIYVDVSTDGGLTWTNTWSKHDLNQSTWKQEMIDLTPYISDRFKVRFRFWSDETGTAGGWTIDDVEIREFETAPILTYPFFDDFESGTGDWIVSSRDWNLSDEGYVSPTDCFSESPNRNYANYSDAIAQSAGFMDLSSAVLPALTFWVRCAMSTHGYSDDYIYVDVSMDGGWTWQTVWYRHDLNQSTWRQEVVDLSPYVSDHFKMRFRLISDETGVAAGCDIDDVRIGEFE